MEVQQRHRPPRPSTVGIQRTSMMHGRRHRRRSSARFLQLSNHHPAVADNDDDSDAENKSDDLQDIYQRALRLNAENKINASNSWSLRLIENIDTFLAEEEEEDKDDDNDESKVQQSNQKSNSETPRRVNFTKASCTLDASVKIYSYRVDDVHLTSYKVLANLHRNSNKSNNDQQQSKNNKSKDLSSSQQDGNEDESSNGATASTKANSTLEHNVANINMNNLDSAFDIDPLFSKMSKAFDEGGAKGLLLANLSVSEKACNIVFDSKAESPNEDPVDPKSNSDTHMVTNKDVDLSSLKSVLREATGTHTDHAALDALQKLAFVPQLSIMRNQFDELEEEGFIDADGVAGGDPTMKPRGHYFEVNEEEEREADRSIHQEALERSRVSVNGGRPSLAESDDGYAGGNAFDDDDDDAFGGDGGNFLNVTPQRPSSFSASSFAAPNSPTFPDMEESLQPKTSTSALLDALSNSSAFWADKGDSCFWKPELLESQGMNHWAGVSHWKPSKRKQKTTHAVGTNPPRVTPKRSTKKSQKKKRVLIDFNKKGMKFETGKALIWSATTLAKHSRNENVLPVDAGIFSLGQLTSLFLRPSMSLQSRKPKKAVGFADPPDADDDGWPVHGGNDFMVDDGDDDDDEGGGYYMPEDVEDPEATSSEFLPHLEGVRKVEKVHVDYATVAKKVDVKKLKRDLWQELEQTFAPTTTTAETDKDEIPTSKLENERTSTSFHNAVQTLEASQSQTDVTLPFYFICLLHLANEKGLRLVQDEGCLDDFDIGYDDNTVASATMVSGIMNHI